MGGSQYNKNEKSNTEKNEGVNNKNKGNNKLK